MAEQLDALGDAIGVDALFGFNGSERLARTALGWLTPEVVTSLSEFCFDVAKAYATARTEPTLS